VSFVHAHRFDDFKKKFLGFEIKPSAKGESGGEDGFGGGGGCCCCSSSIAAEESMMSLQ
jgi:hypothetical protein